MSNRIQDVESMTAAAASKPACPGAPINPEELTRRLAAHVADLKRQNERRAQRAVVLRHGPYHHVPRVAATDFARTATPDGMGRIKGSKGKVHKLAQPALKHYLCGDSHGLSGMTGWRSAQSVDNLRTASALVRERNQFQMTADLECAAQLDRMRGLNTAQQRAFDSDILHMRRCQECARNLPLSMADVKWEQGAFHGQSAPLYSDLRLKVQPVHRPLDRHDWVQQDDAPVEQRKAMIRFFRDKWGRTTKEPTKEWSCNSSSNNKPRRGGLLNLFKRQAFSLVF